MPPAIKLLFDEDIHAAVAEAMRARGYDTVRVQDVNRLGLSDEQQLQYAVEHHRAIVTFNMGDYVLLHERFIMHSRPHYGILTSKQLPIGELVRRLVAALERDPDLRDQLVFL